jgi:eukaryotic translation initiation factor 2C
MHKPSMTGLVASMDANFTRYAAFSSIQSPRLEIIDKLDKMMDVSVISVFMEPVFELASLSAISGRLDEIW